MDDYDIVNTLGHQSGRSSWRQIVIHDHEPDHIHVSLGTDSGTVTLYLNDQEAEGLRDALNTILHNRVNTTVTTITTDV